MAQPDPAIIARAFTDLGEQLPLISNHPTVQMLAQAQNFQEEMRALFAQQKQQFAQQFAQQYQQNQQFAQQFAQQNQQLAQQNQHFAQQFAQQNQQNQQFAQQLAQIQGTLDEMKLEFRTGLDRVSRDQALLPLRLYNTSAGNKAHLRYPDGVQAQAITRDELLTSTVPQCQQLATALGLPALLPNAAVQDRRQQIASYLGVSI